MLTHEEIRQLYYAYREKARQLLTVGDDRLRDPAFKVGQNAYVQIMGDGAFVECVVWVPKELLDE